MPRAQPETLVGVPTRSTDALTGNFHGWKYNDPEAVMRVVVPFGSNVHAAIEASTGVAALTQKHCAEQLIAQSSWLVELAHPGYVARMKQTPDKSDWTDAKLLAGITRTGYIPRVWLALERIQSC
jgi:hypothetical protein